MGVSHEEEPVGYSAFRGPLLLDGDKIDAASNSLTVTEKSPVLNRQKTDFRRRGFRRFRGDGSGKLSLVSFSAFRSTSAITALSSPL